MNTWYLFPQSKSRKKNLAQELVNSGREFFALSVTEKEWDEWVFGFWPNVAQPNCYPVSLIAGVDFLTFTIGQFHRSTIDGFMHGFLYQV